MMRSEKWTATKDVSKIRTRGLPFIQENGHISGSVHQTWKSTAFQWYATLVRSIIQRINRRNKDQRTSKRKSRYQLTLIAIFYASTYSDYIFERLLCCHTREFTRVYNYYKHNMDAKTRFLNDQAVNAASWFQLRGNPRVKSIKKTVLPEYRRLDIQCFDSRRERRDAVQALSDPWIVENQYCTKNLAVLAIN